MSRVASSGWGLWRAGRLAGETARSRRMPRRQQSPTLEALEDRMLLSLGGEISGRVLADPGSGTSNADVVYRNDFEQPSDLSNWSHPLVELSPSGRSFLGQFQNEFVKLQLGGLPAHTALVASFDLYVIWSWQGNNSYYFGPDIWTTGVGG